MSLKVTVIQEVLPTMELGDESLSLIQTVACHDAPYMSNMPTVQRIAMLHDIGSVPHMTCKGSDHQEDIDVSMMSQRPTSRLSRRPRPLHDGTEQWLWDLGSLFSQHAVQEVIDGDSYIYVQTWYVDHVHHSPPLDQPEMKDFQLGNQRFSVSFAIHRTALMYTYFNAPPCRFM